MKLPIETAHLVDERIRQQLPDATLVQVVCCAAHAAVWQPTARMNHSREHSGLVS
jgi:hypothetical protein